MLDLHYMRHTIVLMLEDSHRNSVHTNTNALCAFKSSRLSVFSLYKVECLWGRQAHVLLMWLSLQRYPCTTTASPTPMETSCQSWKEVSGINLQSQNFNTLIFSTAKSTHNAPFICLGGIGCAQIFACSQDCGKTEDNRPLPKKTKDSGLCQGLVCMRVCSYLETDGLPADWNLSKGWQHWARKERFLGRWVRDIIAKTKKWCIWRLLVKQTMTWTSTGGLSVTVGCPVQSYFHR